MPEVSVTTADFRARARRLHRWRRAISWLWDGALLSAGLACAGSLATLLSARGDLAAGACIASALGWTLARASWAWRSEQALRARAGAGQELLVAMRILDTPGPLAQPALTNEHDGDAELRHELLSATSLELELERGNDSKVRSPSLALAYIERVAGRLAAADIRRAIPRLEVRRRLFASFTLATIMLAGAMTPSSAQAFDDLVHARDKRPPAAPQRIWTRLELHLSYPEHTARATRRVPNPSGALRVVAGTQITLDFWTRRDSPHARILLAHTAGPNYETPAPEIIELKRVPSQTKTSAGEGRPKVETRWQGRFTVRGPADWTVLLFDELDDDPTAHSRPGHFELEEDAPPEVELERHRQRPREASELSEIRVGFQAHDDFGLRSAQLVYRRADGSLHRIPVDPGPPNQRRWKRRARLDLSSIPSDERGQLEYWIEVRDNDPGLGLRSLRDPPGKVGSSAHQKLQIRDREREHAQNVQSLRELRDAFVDLLAARLGSHPIFAAPRDMLAELLKADPDSPTLDELEPETRRVAIDSRALSQLRAARILHEASASVLAMLAGSVDALSVDPLVRERDLRNLAAMHARLLELYRKEDEFHTRLPAGSDMRAGGQRIGRLLRQLGAHDRKEQTQLEDEIIRLDDLVDGELIRQLETLTARLEAGQQKLVELLEQLKAGDESVRPQIDELEARLREDMQRYRVARQQLSKEVGEEYFNRDAFANLEAMMQRQGVLAALREGDIDKALQQARETLDEMRSVNDAVQQRASQGGEDSRLDPMEAARMKLLRELGRLNDLQGGLTGSANELHERWRASVSGVEVSGSSRARAEAKKILKGLDKINDARLSRAGRDSLEDAREALTKVVRAPESVDTRSETALPLWEAADAAFESLRDSLAGLPEDDKNTAPLRELKRAANSLRSQLRRPLPSPADSLEAASIESARARSIEQHALEGQAQELLRSDLWEGQPPAALEHLEDAAGRMEEAVAPFAGANGLEARKGTRASSIDLQQAIDALRQSTPPPSESSQEDSSTEAERDRSLRDQVVEAMRERRADQLGDSVSRYYEELLK